MHKFTYRFKMSRLTVVLIIITVAIFGCEKEKVNYPSPLIQFVTDSGFVFSDTILALGQPFKVGINATNPKVNLTNFIIKVDSDENEIYLDSGMNTPNLYFERYITKGIKEFEKWIFIIRDRNGKSAEVSLNIAKDSSSTFGDINYFSSVELGAQNNAVGNFFSLSEDSVYSLNSAYENQNTIDLCYYYDFIDTDENTIASPGANIDNSVFPGTSGLSNWAIRKTSRFKTANITEQDFMNATNDSLLIVVYGQSDGNRKAKNLQSGNIFSFKNENGKVGLFKVNSVSGTDTGNINISIKVQE